MTVLAWLKDAGLGGDRDLTLHRSTERLDLRKHYSEAPVMPEDGDLTGEDRVTDDAPELEAFAHRYEGANVASIDTGSYRCVYNILEREMDDALVNTS